MLLKGLYGKKVKEMSGRRFLVMTRDRPQSWQNKKNTLYLIFHKIPYNYFRCSGKPSSKQILFNYIENKYQFDQRFPVTWHLH